MTVQKTIKTAAVSKPKRTRKPSASGVTANDAQVRALASEMIGRARLASVLGKSFGGNRDLYEAIGYPRVLCFADYNARYARQDIARRVVNAYPDATWRRPPQVLEDESDYETDFESRFNQIATETRLFHYVLRADRLAGVGYYAVLFLGFDDGKPLDTPVTKSRKLLYCQPYDESQAAIHAYDLDPRSSRYGLPEMYNLTMQNSTTGAQARLVHWSRLIHVADNAESNDVFGTPRLQSVYNRLQDIETIVAGSAEMFWKGGFPGYAFQADADADMSVQSMNELQTEIDEYVNKMKRYLRVQGVEVKELRPQIADPSNHVEVQVNLISSATGIPKRILIGSEMGKLASEQDKENWRDRVDERRATFAEPIIMRTLIDRLITVGLLPKVKQYIIKWPEIDTLSEREEADIAKIKSEAINSYSSSPESIALFPPFHFFTKVLGMTSGEAKAVLESSEIGDIDEPLPDSTAGDLNA